MSTSQKLLYSTLTAAAGLFLALAGWAPLLGSSENSTSTESSVAPASAPVHTFATDQEILSIAAIPATTHRGKSRIVAAHGDAGVSIRDTSGTVLSTIDTPARLVSHYQGFLVVYSQEDNGSTTLRRFTLAGNGQATLVDSASPSPIAATTLQRTEIAALGPVRIDNTRLLMEDGDISLPSPIVAVAAASYFPPLVAGRTLLIAMDNGDITIYAR